MRRSYYATVVDGLEEVARGEIEEALPATEFVRFEQGRVFFDSSCDLRSLLALRSVENVHALVTEFAEVTPDPASLSLIRERLAAARLEGAVQACEAIVGPLPDPSFRITASRSGTHEFRSLDVAAAAGQGIVDAYGWRVDLTGFDVEVRVDVRQDTCLVGLRLSPQTLSQRSRVEHAAASLKSTVAHCMIRLLGWSPGDVFLDPMCGAGTILVERAVLGECAALLGADRDEGSVAKARANLSALDAKATLLSWDARRMGLGRGTVSRLVCNLPWGRRVGSHRTNQHLYPGFVREVARVLREDGRAALLTADKHLLTRLVHRHPRLRLDETWPLQLGGLHPSIYTISRCPRTRS